MLLLQTVWFLEGALSLFFETGRAVALALVLAFACDLAPADAIAADWRFGARFRNYTYDNHMPVTSITQYVAYDSSVSTTP